MYAILYSAIKSDANKRAGYFAKAKAAFLLLVLVLVHGSASAVTKTSAGTGNWGTAATWSPSGVPASTDDVIISSGDVITVNGNYTCNNLDIGTSANNDATLQITVSSNSLTINGAIRINPSNKTKVFTLDAGPGTIYLAGTFTSWSTSGTNKLVIGTGTMTITPAISIASANQKIVFTGAGTLNFNAGFTDAQNGLTTFTGCVVNFNSFYKVNTNNASWAGKGTAHFINGSITTKTILTLNDVYLNAGTIDTFYSAAGSVVIGGSLTFASGTTLIANKNFEVDGDWTNNGGTLTGTATIVTLNGTANTIGGTSSTTFPTLQIGKTSGTSATSYTANINTTCSNLILDGGAYNRTLNLASGTTLTVSSNVTINQPTAANITSALMVNSGTCNVSGNLVFAGTTNTATYVGKVAVTSGAFTLSGNVTWMSNSESATEVITVSTGTITFASSLTMGSNSGTLSVTGAGTINFNGSAAPSFNFGGAAVSPIFTTASGSTLNFNNGFTNSTNALTLSSSSNAVFTASGTITAIATLTFGNIQINSGATLTLGGDISLKGNWSNSGTFAPSTYGVTFNASSPNIQTITKSGGETFYSLGASNAGATLTFANDVTVTNALTMGGANLNLNGYTLTLGSGAAASLSRSGGIAYGGTWKRWLPTSAISSTSGSYYGLIPTGTSADYRPVEINSTSNPATAGYLIATRYDTVSLTIVTYTDNEGDAIEDIADITNTLSTSGLAGGTYNLDISYTGLSDKGVTTDLKLETYTAGVMGSYGASAATTGTVIDPTVKRTGITAAQLSNVWVIGSKRKNITPIREFYYSRKTGNWNDVTAGNGTWSHVSGGSGVSCDCAPTSSGCVVIESGHVVTVNVASAIDYVDINDGGNLTGGSGISFTVNKDFSTHGSGSFTNAGTWALNRLCTLTATSSSSSTGSFTVLGAFTVPASASYTQTGGTLNISGDLILSGTITSNGASFNINGTGSAISGTGSITGTSGDNINITNSKAVVAGSALTIGSVANPLNLTLNGVLDFTNNGSIIINGNINGTNASSQWINDDNSTLQITGNMLSTGKLDASSAPNTVTYNGSGAQTVKGPYTSYYNLSVANAGTKTLAGNCSVTNALTISGAAILDETTYALTGAATLTMSGTSELKMQRSASGTYPELTGAYTLTAGTVTINQTVGIATLTNAAYYHLKLTGTQACDISAINTINSDFDVQNASSIINNVSLAITGNLNYSSSGVSALSGNLSAAGVSLTGGTLSDAGRTITVNGAGGWTLSGGTFVSTGTTVFTGGTAQQIGGSNRTTFNILNINNSAGVTLNVSPAAATIVTGALVLTNGVLYTTGNSIRLLDNVISSSGSASSYVDGPMIKVGNDDFIFPVGKGGRWRRAGIFALVDPLTEVTAEYFANGYSTLTPLSDSLTQVSPSEYWDIDRTISIDPVGIRLYWEDATVSGIIDCNYLAIAHWKANTQWEKEPATVLDPSSCTGNGSGSIETTGWVSSFSPFTFGGSGGTALPVTLLSFDAVPEGSRVKLNWLTAVETNSDYFAVERSADGIHFTEIDRMKAAGNSTTQRAYQTYDMQPLGGISYYRLRPVDMDASFTFSKTVAVNFAEQITISLYPNPTDNELSFNISNPKGEVKVIIYDMAGRKVYAQLFPADGQNSITIQAKYLLPPGVYMVSASSGGAEYHEKVILN
jgi:fibronectin-binding autotransporter adhesin